MCFANWSNGKRVLSPLRCVPCTSIRSGSARRITVGTTAIAVGVQITVADNGPGIDPAIASRLFESFATTKPRGLGLGLSIAQTIVEAHGGTIDATSDAGHGAVFRIVLPTAGADADGEELRAPSSGNSLQ